MQRKKAGINDFVQNLQTSQPLISVFGFHSYLSLDCLIFIDHILLRFGFKKQNSPLAPSTWIISYPNARLCGLLRLYQVLFIIYFTSLLYMALRFLHLSFRLNFKLLDGRYIFFFSCFVKHGASALDTGFWNVYKI